MSRIPSVASGLLIAALLTTAGGMSVGQDQPGQLHRLTKPGRYIVSVGDILVIARQSNPALGPGNPAANLTVQVEGQGLAAKKYVVLAPPARPAPGSPGPIQAYLFAESVGDATVTVTPVSGSGQPGEALRYMIKVTHKPGPP